MRTNLHNTTHTKLFRSHYLSEDIPGVLTFLCCHTDFKLHKLCSTYSQVKIFWDFFYVCSGIIHLNNNYIQLSMLHFHFHLSALLNTNFFWFEVIILPTKETKHNNCHINLRTVPGVHFMLLHEYKHLAQYVHFVFS